MKYLRLVLAGLVFFASAAWGQVGQIPTYIQPNLVPAGPAAAAALALLPATPSTATRNKMVTAINTLANTAPTTSGLTGSLWSNMDAFWFIAADNTPNSVIDATGHGYTLSPTGNETFLPLVGYFGDGATGYITTGFVPSTNGVNFKLNSASYGLIVANNRTTNQAMADLGSVNTSNDFDWIFPLFSDGNAYGSISGLNSTGAANASGTKAVWLSTRTNSTTVTLYKNGTQLATGTNNSGALTTFQVLLGAGCSTSTTCVPGDFSTDTLSVAFAGAGFNAADAAAINTALQPWLPASIPTVAAAWGFTNTVFAWTPSGLTDIDTGLTNGPSFNWYLTQFWGEGNPSGSDVTYSSPALIINPSSNAAQYRPRLSTRGNTSSTFQGSVSSGGVLTVSSMIGVNPTQGGTAYINPVIVGAPGTCQLLAGAGMGVTQPSHGRAHNHRSPRCRRVAEVNDPVLCAAIGGQVIRDEFVELEGLLKICAAGAPSEPDLSFCIG
jgi:hypothetical protein